MVLRYRRHQVQLKWIGDPRNVVGVAGWPASDHDEPSLKAAKAKLKSGLYEKVAEEAPLTPEELGPASQEEAS